MGQIICFYVNTHVLKSEASDFMILKHRLCACGLGLYYLFSDYKKYLVSRYSKIYLQELFPGGLELALMCDMRVMEETAKIGFLNRRFGVPLIDGGSVRTPELIGLSRALDLIITGRLVEAKVSGFLCGGFDLANYHERFLFLLIINHRK